MKQLLVVLFCIVVNTAVGENSLYSDLALRRIEGLSSEMKALWVSDPEGYIKKRTEYLERMRRDVQKKISKCGNSSIDITTLPFDPFTSELIVPPAYYSVWLFCHQFKVDDAFIREALLENSLIEARNMHNESMPKFPDIYLVLSVYSKPQAEDIHRWMRTIEKDEIKQEILMGMFNYSQYDNKTIRDICVCIIKNDVNATTRYWAANVLVSLPSGATYLEKVLKNITASDELRQTIEPLIYGKEILVPYGKGVSANILTTKGGRSLGQ